MYIPATVLSCALCGVLWKSYIHSHSLHFLMGSHLHILRNALSLMECSVFISTKDGVMLTEHFILSDIIVTAKVQV